MEFYKPNLSIIKTFVTIVIVAVISVFIIGNAFASSFSSGMMFGPPSQLEIYQVIAGFIALVLLLPLMAMWMVSSFIKMEMFGVILGLPLTVFYWYYLACWIGNFKESKKKNLSP